MKKQTRWPSRLSKILPTLFAVSLACTAAPRAAAQSPARDLNAPAPEAARREVRRAVALADGERAREAAALLRKVVAAAPDFLRAHVEYVRVLTFHLGSYGVARAEYEARARREPWNPVYPVALALGTGYLAPERTRRAWLGRAAALAPEWAWGHYARAQSLAERDPAAAAAELDKCVEKDPGAAECYALLLSLQKNKLGRPGDALATAERMSARAETRAAGLAELWRLRAGGGEAAKSALRSELDQLIASSSEIDLLAAARRAYFELLRDAAGGRRAEARIRQLDAGWFEERGWTFSFTTADGRGVPQQRAIAGRQVSLCFAAYGLGGDLSPKERMARLEALLSRGPNTDLKWYLYGLLLDVAEKSKDAPAVVRYAEALLALDPEGPAWRAKIALALAEQGKEVRRALRLAREADSMTREARAPRRSPNTDPDFFADTVTQEWRRKNHAGLRSLALAAHGLAQLRAGRRASAEAKLREAASLARSEESLTRWAESLRALGRAEEAGRVAAEAAEAFAASVRRGFVDEPAQGFDLETADGDRVKLSDLKGRVVLLNFWATWCGPCVKEAPQLVKLRERHRARGFEVLAVSIDDKADRFKVRQFAKDYGLTFPVLFDEGVSRAYRAGNVPVSVFIDRAGRVRYRETGYDEQTPRKFEIVVAELLK